MLGAQLGGPVRLMVVVGSLTWLHSDGSFTGAAGPPSPAGWVSPSQSRAPRSPGKHDQLTLRLKLAHLPFWCMLLVKASSQGQPRPTGRGDGLRLLVGGRTWHRDGGDCQGLSLETGYQHVTVGQWQVGKFGLTTRISTVWSLAQSNASQTMGAVSLVSQR